MRPQLGRILDKMDEYNLWEDTMLIVNTDHGFMLGEHDWWAKSNHINYYEEIVHTPLFIYDPRSRAAGRCDCLVQTIDLRPPFLTSSAFRFRMICWDIRWAIR